MAVGMLVSVGVGVLVGVGVGVAVGVGVGVGQMIPVLCKSLMLASQAWKASSAGAHRLVPP